MRSDVRLGRKISLTFIDMDLIWSDTHSTVKCTTKAAVHYDVINVQATLQVHSSYLKQGPVLGPLHQIKRLACKNICGNMSWSKAAMAQEYPNGSGLNWNTSVHSVYKVWTSPPKCFNCAKLLHLKFYPPAKLSLRETSSKLLMK